MLIGATGLTLLLAAASIQSPEDLGPQVNQLAPDFTLEDSSGRTYRLSDFRGQKSVVLEFFRSGSW